MPRTHHIFFQVAGGGGGGGGGGEKSKSCSSQIYIYIFFCNKMSTCGLSLQSFKFPGRTWQKTSQRHVKVTDERR